MDEFHLLIEKIENSTTEEEILENLKFLIAKNSNLNSNLPLNNLNINYKISSRVENNENSLKSAILNNSENIIKMFNNLKEIKEDLNKSKRGLDALIGGYLM